MFKIHINSYIDPLIVWIQSGDIDIKEGVLNAQSSGTS